jgi:hypothetical protein
MQVEKGRASGTTVVHKIDDQTDACLFTIDHDYFVVFSARRETTFAPKSANPYDNLYLELRLSDTTEQHRTDCYEKGALKETETAARGQTLQLDLW